MQQLAAGSGPVVPLPHPSRPGKIKCVEVEGVSAWVYPCFYPLTSLRGKAPKLSLPHHVSRALSPGCSPLPERGSMVLQVKVPVGAAPPPAATAPPAGQGSVGGAGETVTAAPGDNSSGPAAAAAAAAGEGAQGREDTPGGCQVPHPGAQAAATQPQLPAALPGEWVTAQQVDGTYRRYHSPTASGVLQLTSTLLNPMSAVLQLTCWADWSLLAWELVSGGLTGCMSS
jgi:hypothetical protein